jgi:diguanylate cyclase (GGDEF)-like protein
MTATGASTFRIPQWRAVAALLTALLLVTPAWSAASSDYVHLPIRFKHLTMADGLSQSTILALFEDSQGYVWLATENGLNRYNGYNFDVHQRDRQQSSTLQDDFIWAVDEDNDHNIWVATDSAGIARWERDTNTWAHFLSGEATGLSDDRTRTLRVLKDGTMLVGTRAGGLDHFDPATGRVITNFRNFDGNVATSEDDAVYTILAGGGSRYFVGTDAGLFRVDLKSREVLAVRPDEDTAGATAGKIRSLVRDGAGRLWVGTKGLGIVMLDAQGRFVAAYSHDEEEPGSLSHNHVTAIRQDRNGRIWVASKGGLDLYQAASQRFVHYRADPQDSTSLVGTQVMSLLEDHSGLLWVGTQTRGVSIFNPRSWAFGHYEPSDSDSTAVVTSFVETADGELWMGTFGDGLQRLERAAQTGQVIGHGRLDYELGDDNVMALDLGADGSIWVGLMRAGLRRIDPATGEVTAYRHDDGDPNSLSSDSIMALHEDSSGVVWVGTFGGGVNRLQPDGTITRITSASGLSHDQASVVLEDRDGYIWVGTNAGGLNLLSPEGEVLATFRRESQQAASLASDTIYALHVDDQGTLWIGGKGGVDQLLRTTPDPSTWRFRNYSTREGLSNNTVWGIERDNSGQLWISTNFGLTRFDPVEGSSRVFHQEHGLQGEEFNFGAHFATADGALCFGGANGLNAFYPTRLQLNRRPPPTVLTSILKLNKPLDTPPGALDALELAYSDDAVTFEFSALDFTAPERNQYAYMLEGFDSDWIRAGTIHRVTYTNLDKGQYVFRVRARNSDGFWNDDGIALPVLVSPAPWQTWWAYLLYSLAAIAAVLAVPYAQHMRLRREEQYRHRLEREVSERTHELAVQTETLKTLNEKLQRSSFTDPLTGLNNRRFLFEGIAGQINDICKVHEGTGGETPDDLLFVMIDLDNFKPVNDGYGHAAGDSLLIQITEVLHDACDADHDWIIRWGGDEFLVVRRLKRTADPVPMVEKLRSCVSNTLVPVGDGHLARTTSSIGFARYPFVREAPELVSWEQVITIADHAMYAAKETRNTFVGYCATEKTARCEDLLSLLQRDALGALEDGTIAERRPLDTESPARSA